MPNKILVPEVTNEVTINCYSLNMKTNLHLEKSNQTAIEAYLPNETIKLHDNLLKSVFKIRNPTENIGKYRCISEENTSMYPTEILLTSEPKWSKWTEWSSCFDPKNDVGSVLVNRSRTRNVQDVETEQRYCRCSDLADLPRPR